MEIPFFQVDAFTARAFGGNPAAVCPLESWLPDATLQSIAMENNLSETAFFVPVASGFHLRWFTPLVEVDLCGHATLASAFVVMNHLEPGLSQLRFTTQKAGDLTVSREGDRYLLDFPSRPPHRATAPDGLLEALGGNAIEVWCASDYMAVYASEAEVRALAPKMDQLASLDIFAAIATAPGDDSDFVSRFFAPAKGIPEDPVTGRAHCTLIPFWADRLGKSSLRAKQVSRRGGELFCRSLGDRVEIGGHAVLFAEGVIRL